MAAQLDLMTSTEVALLLGVSPSSVKRWAEEGLLPCAKTMGRHRRFERAVVERFRRSSEEAGGLSAGAGARAWVDRIIEADDPQRLAGLLLEERGRVGSWWRVAEDLGPAIAAIGQRWADGELTVLEEHLSTECLARALARACEWMPVAAGAPRALLATAEGDDHTLGLALVEVCLREIGWRTLWAGRRTPTLELTRRVASPRSPVRLLCVSASAASTDEADLAGQARRLGEACRAAKVALVLGGAGAWPARPPYGARLRSIEGLRAYVLGLTEARP